MSLIDINNLTFGYDGSSEIIFKNVNLHLNSDWKLGLVGRNGKGKTTLLKLLHGDLEYRGTIVTDMDCEYYPYEISDRSQYVYEIIEQINPNYIEWQIRRELNLLNFGYFDFYRRFNTYSEGEQAKIMFAILFSKDNAFLLIDEPTNHLDADGRNALAQYLSKKSAFIIVSHDRRFMDGCIDHVISINKANIEVVSGNLSTYLDNKQMQDDAEVAHNERLKKDIKRLDNASRQSSAWADKCEKSKFGGKQESSGLRPDRGFIGAKSAKLMKRATALNNRLQDSIEEKSALLRNIDSANSMKITSENFHKEQLLSVRKLVISYNGIEVNVPLTFEVMQGDRILLSGGNGSGKSSVLKAIIGELNSFNGIIERNKQLKISYVSQDTKGVKGDLSQFCRDNAVDKTELITKLIYMGVEKSHIEVPLDAYSQGQKKKLLIAKSMCDRSNLYIWDEPLNYIDIISRIQIQDMLIASNISLIFVEHDEEFRDAVATKRIEVSPQQLAYN